METYKEKIEELSSQVSKITRMVYKDDWDFRRDIRDLVVDVTLTLEMDIASKSNNYLKFVDGLLGWIKYGQTNDLPTSTVLTNIIHDLSEFSRHRHEKWFSPRSSGYTKYLTGGSEVASV